MQRRPRPMLRSPGPSRSWRRGGETLPADRHHVGHGIEVYGLELVVDEAADLAYLDEGVLLT
jgi:hypothetical protein